MDDFELGKAGWFEVQNVFENDFLNQKLESDKYGIWYTVKFTGDASTHLWQTKTPPVEGEKYWGSIELTKSGKTTKFKWDKQNAPGSENAPAKGYQKSPEQEESIARAVALKAAVEANARHDMPALEILEWADTFLLWLKGEKPTTDETEQPKSKADKVFNDGVPLPEHTGDEVD